ncbi:lipopolysaccharide biosynthesis protein [Roseobacter sp.]|uniref:lipopolysaccharide biosynthesis protein n=1 Tax=Roseobacter sp. TaxID=1907202 RepID=UPI00385C53D2
MARSSTASERASPTPNTHMTSGRLASLKGLVYAGGAKAAGALISVVFSLVAARILGATEAGYLFLGLTLLFVGSAVFRLGFDAKLTRRYGADGIGAVANQVLSLAITASLVFASLISGAGFLFADQIATVVFAKPDMASTLGYICLALAPLTLLNTLGFAFQGVRRTVMTVFGQNLGYLMFALLGFAVLGYGGGLSLTSAQGAIILLVSVLISFVIALAIWLWQPGTQLRPHLSISRPEAISNLNLWVAMLMILTVTWSGILIGGRFVSAADLAIAAAAQRVAVLVVFVLLVCDMFVAPQYAKLFAAGDLAQMRRIARISTAAMLAVTIPLVTCLILFSDQVMGLFGNEFAAAGQVLTIFVIGQTVNVATGSVGQLLTMTQYEADYRRVTALAALVTVTLTLLLAPRFGIIGIALAATIGTITQNVVGYIAVRKRLGFFPGL